MYCKKERGGGDSTQGKKTERTGTQLSRMSRNESEIKLQNHYDRDGITQTQENAWTKYTPVAQHETGKQTNERRNGWICTLVTRFICKRQIFLTWNPRSVEARSWVLKIGHKFNVHCVACRRHIQRNDVTTVSVQAGVILMKTVSKLKAIISCWVLTISWCIGVSALRHEYTFSPFSLWFWVELTSCIFFSRVLYKNDPKTGSRASQISTNIP